MPIMQGTHCRHQPDAITPVKGRGQVNAENPKKKESLGEGSSDSYGSRVSAGKSVQLETWIPGRSPQMSRFDTVPLGRAWHSAAPR